MRVWGVWVRLTRVPGLRACNNSSVGPNWQVDWEEHRQSWEEPGVPRMPGGSRWVRRGRPPPGSAMGGREHWASVGGGWWPRQLRDNLRPCAPKCLVCRFGICGAGRHQSQSGSWGVGWGFGAAGCQINGLCHRCPLLGKAGEPGSDSRMKSDRTRKGKAMPTLTGAPAC